MMYIRISCITLHVEGNRLLAVCPDGEKRERNRRSKTYMHIYIYLYTHGRTLCEGKKEKKKSFEYIALISHLSSHQREKIIYLYKIIIIHHLIL